MAKFSDKKSLLDFLNKHWSNGEPMDESNFHMTWDVIVRNLRFDDGVNPDVTITNNNDGTHTIAITNYDGTTESAVIRDGKDGKDGKDGVDGTNGKDGVNGTNGKDGFSPEITVTDNETGEHTLTITKPDGSVSSAVIRDGKNGKDGHDGVNGTNGKDGFSPEVTITDGDDGTHTLTITKPGGDTESAVIRDGKNGADGTNGKDGVDGANGKDGFSPEVTITDGTDGTHTLTVTKSDGSATSTVIKDGAPGKDGTPGKDGAKGDKGDKGDTGAPGFSPEVTITDGTDGTRTLTITKPGGTTASTIIHDGKDGAKGDKGTDGKDGAPGFSPEVTITDGDGTHTLTITKPGGTTASTIIHDGKDGAKGDKGDAGAPGFSPEVTITDGDGTHTLTITKPGGTTASAVIKDGKDGTAGAPGFSPEVTITDGEYGTHTISITKSDGSVSSAVIRDGEDGADGKDGASGFSLTSPIDSNGIALVPYSHTYYPLHGIDVDDSSQKDVYPKYTPDIKVEVNSVAIPASEFTGLTEEQASNGWKAGFIPSSYVITMYSNNLNYTGKSSNGEFHFDIDNLGFTNGQELDIPIDTLKLPTAEKTEKPIHELGFVSNILYNSNSRYLDKSPAVFMKYPETFYIPVFVKEKKADGTDADIKNKYATICLMPDYNEMLGRPILSNDIYTGFIAGMAIDYKQIDGTNLYHYTWAKDTLFVPLTATLLTWDESTGKIGYIYKKQSTDATQVVAEVINETRALSINNFTESEPGLVYNALQANSTGREIMRLFIGNPNAYGLLALD